VSPVTDLRSCRKKDVWQPGDANSGVATEQDIGTGTSSGTTSDLATAMHFTSFYVQTYWLTTQYEKLTFTVLNPTPLSCQKLVIFCDVIFGGPAMGYRPIPSCVGVGYLNGRPTPQKRITGARRAPAKAVTGPSIP
jgi:hypothetical protein